MEFAQHSEVSTQRQVSRRSAPRTCGAQGNRSPHSTQITIDGSPKLLASGKHPLTHP